MNNGVVLATEWSSVSIGQQAYLIKKLLEENNYIVYPHNEYLSSKERYHDLKVLLFFTFIDYNPKSWAMIFSGYRNKKICYILCEGKVDKSYHTPGLYNIYEIYANSYFSKKFLDEAGFKVKGVVHHTVDIKEVEEAKNNPIRFKKPNDNFAWFIFAGQDNKRKRVDLILEAFRRAQEKTNYNIGLLLISNAEKYFRPDDKNIIQIAPFGSLNHLEVLRYMAGADFYLHLTKSESFGIPALESRAVGTPLVCLKMPPTIEFIPENASLWINNTGMIEIDRWGGVYVIGYDYDVDEASEVIAQAYDIYINYKSKYEDMKAKCLENIEEYDYHNKYKVFL